MLHGGDPDVTFLMIGAEKRGISIVKATDTVAGMKIVRFSHFQPQSAKRLCNPLIISALQKHSFWRVKAMLLGGNIYAFTR